LSYLRDRAVVITGAGRGIGRACAHLAAEEGAAVVVNDIDGDVAVAVTDEIAARGGRAVVAVGDVGDWEVAASLIEQCVAEFGALHGLVNNAGRFAMADGGDLDEGHVRAMVETNVIGVIACGSRALARMSDQGFGSIVNIVSGAHFGIPHMSVYGATKGAVASLTYGWALEAAQNGVRVNAVSPLARTRMAVATAAWYRERGHGIIENEGSPDPAVNAPAVVYLLSEASSALNGQILRIEGDQLALVAHPAVREPVLSGQWAVEAIERALGGDLAANLVPLGMGPLLRAEYVEGASAFWDGQTPDQI